MKNRKLFLALVTALFVFGEAYSQSSMTLQSDKATDSTAVWDNYSKVFLEFNVYYNLRRFGFGATAAYIPTRFGGYASYKRDGRANNFTLGAICRPLKWEKLDMQFFAGPMLRIDYEKNVSLTPEIGIRLSPNKVGNAGWFGLWSVTASYAYFGRKQSYYMIGASVSFTSIVSLFVLASENLRF